MINKIRHPHSPYRIFGFSAFLTVTAIAAVLITKGIPGMIAALILIAVEVAFSFDNAILNAKVLSKMSPKWQTLFLTVGALIAIFGMRVIFPVVLVALTAGVGLGEVVNLALHHPAEYAEKLEQAHPALSSFGGAFLLILALDFFVDETQEVVWLTKIEHKMRKLARSWAPPVITLLVVAAVSLLPFNHHDKTTAIAGALGALTYTVIHGLTAWFGKFEKKETKVAHVGTQVGMAAFVSFLYLEMLDATFSFDSVLGAFAVTSDVVLIAVGLGIGAFWVRSLTIFMVRRRTLSNYIYIEHGAHYTIAILAVILFVSLFVRVPEVITGMAGIGVIIASIIASRQALASNGKK